MSDQDRMNGWERVADPREALRALVEHSDFLGYDPYYADLRAALLEMCKRCGKPPTDNERGKEILSLLDQADDPQAVMAVVEDARCRHCWNKHPEGRMCQCTNDE